MKSSKYSGTSIFEESESLLDIAERLIWENEVEIDNLFTID